MLCLLVSVYHPYRWVAESTARLLDAFWPEHPPLFFCGLTSAEAGTLPHLPCHDPALPRSWAGFVKDACGQLRARGFDSCYFLLEDQPPLARCDHRHLTETIPGLMRKLGGVYCGLMGWDNRRFTTRAPVLAEENLRLMHLAVPSAPRFHLHPSWWNLETLEACASLVFQTPTHTPWAFEKACEKTDANLPVEWKSGCYQISAEALMQPAAGKKLVQRTQRFLFHRLMALAPLAQRLGFGPAYWDGLGFDNFFYEGPYPMFYAGVMSRGRLNPFLQRWIEAQKNPHPLFGDLLRASAASTKS